MIEEEMKLLNAQFPAKSVLTAEEVASVFGKQRQWIYDLIHSDRFPIPILKVGRDIVVSKVQVAKFLCEKISYTAPKIPEIITSKKGRPRKTTTSIEIRLAFINDLEVALNKLLAKSDKSMLSDLIKIEDIPLTSIYNPKKILK